MSLGYDVQVFPGDRLLTSRIAIIDDDKYRRSLETQGD